MESISLLYLNPPYDFEVGQQGNKGLALVFLEHAYRWPKPKGVLVFVLPQAQLTVCARLLAEQLIEQRVYRLTEPESHRYSQVAVMAVRRPRNLHPPDSTLLQSADYLRRVAEESEVPPLQAMMRDSR